MFIINYIFKPFKIFQKEKCFQFRLTNKYFCNKLKQENLYVSVY